MNGGNSIFVSGTILGAALGFTAGHLFVWGQNQTNSELHRPVTAAPTATFDHSDSPYFPPRDDFSWLASSDESPIDIAKFAGAGDVVFADIQEPDPTMAIVSGASSGESQAATGIEATADEPEALPNDAAAVPITIRNAEEDEQLLNLLRTELPKLTDEQRHAWLDVVRGMPHNEVTEILNIWKHMGGRPPEIVPPLAFKNSVRSPEISTPPSSMTQTGVEEITQVEKLWRARLARARKVVLNNLFHLDTPGYVRGNPLEAMLSNSTDPTDGEAESLDFSKVSGIRTGRLLDFAFNGPQFFELQSGDTTAYTKWGRFTLNSDRALVQVRHGVEWKLVPEIRIGADIDSEQITDNRVVELETTNSAGSKPWWEALGLTAPFLTTFPHPERLSRGADDLLLASEGSGLPRKRSLDVQDASFFFSGMLENSNATVDNEAAALDEIEARWKLFERIRQLPE